MADLPAGSSPALWAPIAAVVAAVVTAAGTLLLERMRRPGSKHDAIRSDAEYLDKRLAESRKEIDQLYRERAALVEENQRLRAINDATVVHATAVSGAVHELVEKGALDVGTKPPAGG